MKISVYITSYNQKNYLIKALDSVLAQTLPPHQIIIVDDCSTDGSQEVIAGYVARYPELVTPIYHEQNTGVAQVRIDALNAVTSDYVTYVDGDDRLLPTKLEKEAGILQNTANADIAFSNNRYISEEGVQRWVWAAQEKPPQGHIFAQTFGRKFPRNSLFRMELVNYQAWRKVGFHDPQLKVFEDYDMRIRLTKHLQAAYYDEILSEIHVHGKGLSSGKPLDLIPVFEYIYQKNAHLLNDLSKAECQEIQHNFNSYVARAVKSAMKQSLQNGQINREDEKRLFRYCFHYMKYQPIDFYPLFLKLFLPPVIYRFIRSFKPIIDRTKV